MLKKYDHAPAHLFVDNTPYFITGAIYEKRHLLSSLELKQQLLDVLAKSFSAFNWKLDEWVILDNHYHLLGFSDKGKDLSRLMKRIHGASAQFIREVTNCEPPVWWNYWDYCPRDERDYRIRQNYLFNNPFKHGYVENLRDYPFSSFQRFLQAESRDTALEQFRKYHEYRELIIEEDDF